MDPATASADSCQPLRILSLDGGGIRGISSLLILERIMERICDAEDLDHVPRPCDQFDLIGGTSTGGIIAIMLGKLGMTVDECIRAYRQVAEQAFTPKRTSILPASPTGAFSAKALENAMKQIVREYCTNVECVTRRRQGHATVTTCPHSNMVFRDDTCTKTVVLAITKDNVDAPPTLFKTYDRSAAFESSTLWQVARATSAATTFFKSIKVGRDEIEFIDAGFGYNNPCNILIQEAQREFPDRGKMRILSIGTGLGDVVTIQNKRLSIITALKRMASSSKKVAADVDHRYGGNGEYYRFNVDQGLQDITLSDWEKASKISAHTRNYLAENERVIKQLIGEITCHSQVSGKPFFFVPLRQNGNFVGRGKELDELKQKVLAQKDNGRLAVFGLGGIGKTQIALQVSYWARQAMPAHSIFWIPALSKASFEQACTQIVAKLGISKISDNEDAMESVQRHLSLQSTGPWLLIVDNADDMDLLFGSSDSPGGMSQYFPESEMGVTLLTTRSREIAVSFAGNQVITIQNMNLQETTGLLENSLIKRDTRQDRGETVQLLEELNYLPLAITQAAAYMNTADISISKYLSLLRGKKSDAVRLLGRQFQDSTRYRGSQNAVATTWLVSFQQIHRTDEAAANILSFISCIEPKAIPLSLLPDVGSDEELVHAIGTLCGYAFLAERDDASYDMHSLVHLATQVWVREQGFAKQTIEEAVHHLVGTFPSHDYINRRLWQSFLPHSLRTLQESEGRDTKERSELYIRVGRCLEADGRIREAVNCYEEKFRWDKSQYSEEHPDRLASQYELAIVYQADGQVSEAVKLLEHVVAVQERTLAEEHLSRLVSQNGLARAYRADGQISEAVKLLEYVVTVLEITLAKENPYRLASQHELAIVYQADGQVGKAVKLLEHVVAHGLAIAYQANGQVSEAVKLLEYVVAVREKTLAEEHPSRLASQHGLASAYQADGQVGKAVKLLKHVVAVQDTALAEEHPNQLASQHGLAIAYQADGQVSEAVKLLEHVVALREKTLAEEHPSRLASQHGLAIAYQADGQVSEAVKLLEHVVAVREKTLAEKHPDRLESQYGLAIAYQADGQVSEAVKLLEHVVAVREKTLAKKHPDRLASQHALAMVKHEYENERRH
ncbi:Acyl transferase/acyl hydrolase/lysophospholipase [Penicillium griseofulvum]|uniref:Acyl transferase/acyl hydrolase/lysophospholipase n=1 Tax=Penicillium patulum TaxID=5078 RepID=A0A135L8D2_PENPA|nr:Acyl transferase/acyl hydrolase/lysophospholipase [Penicillium griseofulvum]KXG45220.1 Acyl transferase/acyl hydrolase/lysophospholipase [Penicillium griseofulvum]